MPAYAVTGRERERERETSRLAFAETLLRSGTAPSSLSRPPSFVRSFVRSGFIPSPPLFSYKGKGIHPWEEYHFPPAAAAAAWWRATEFNETPPPRIAALDLFLFLFFFFFFFGNLMSALMCKTKMAVEATEPARRPTSSSSPRRPPTSSPRLSASQTPRFAPASSDPSPSASSSGGYYTSTSFPKHSSGTGTSTGTGSSPLSGFRHSLPDNPAIYDFSELRSATNNFLAKPRHSSSSSSCWRCSLRGKDVVVFRRKFRRKIETSSLKELLGMICRSHLVSIAKLLGASVSGDNIFLAYEFVDGASLSDCLRNPKIPNFTVLGTWMSRMQVAADVAHGLDYIHNNTGLNMILVHNHIKSSSVLVTEPSFRAKICHFGTAQLCGEEDENDVLRERAAAAEAEAQGGGGGGCGEITEEGASASPRLKRSDSRRMQFEGARGYMSPEFRVTGVATQKSDVYSFGVVLLELLSGEEPFKYKYNKESREFVRTSIIDTARAAVDGDGGGGAEGRLRKWVDRRLSDSFPVDVAEKLVRLGLECVEADPDRRPDMSRVEGKVSKLYMQSKSWSNSINVPTNISVSIGPR